MNTAKVNDSKFDKLKRRIVKFLRFGKYDVLEAVDVSPYGTDSVPVKDVVAVCSETSTGKPVVIGYLNVERKADVGEHRIYSTDSNAGEKFYIWLKNNGTCEIGGNADNAVRYSKLEQAFNDLKTDFNNLVTIYNSHQHTFVGTGSVGAVTTTGTSSSADISPAKINEIKVP